MTAAQSANDDIPQLDIGIVGAGFAGMYLVQRLRELDFSLRAFEAGDGVGGTWYWNRYPGCRVDIVSPEYSYEFSDALQQEWDWSEKYSTQAELLRYANHVADRFDLRRDIQFNTRVTDASYDEESSRWLVTTDHGEQFSCRYFILATGMLSEANLPPIPGIDDFAGEIYHTAQWPQESVDFSGQRVAVIGTGSSGCQAIPVIAEQARHLTVFQRTPNYVIPANNAPLDPEELKAIKADYSNLRERNKTYPFAFYFDTTDKSALEVSAEERERAYESAWQRGGLMFMGLFNDLLTDDAANATARDFFRRKLLDIVANPDTAAALTPTFSIGCKRLIAGTNYYETYNRPNVTLVSVKDKPIEQITPRGIVVNGELHEVDAIVLATGFDAITGSFLAIDPKGREGIALSEKWRDGARCYLGLMPSGFPNMFTVTGPGSPSYLSNVIKSIEQHVDFIAECLSGLRENGAEVIEADTGAETAWVEKVDAIAEETLFKSCNSWYLGSNIPGKPRVFTGYVGWPEYAADLREVIDNDYRGFQISRSDA